MENFKTRFILTANDLGRIREPVYSRCVSVYIAPPEKDADIVINHVADILTKEDIKYKREDIEHYVDIHSRTIRKVLNQVQRDVINGELIPNMEI